MTVIKYRYQPDTDPALPGSIQGGGEMTRFRHRLQHRTMSGLSLMEALISIGLISLAFAVSFEVFSSYLRLHQQTVGQNLFLLEAISVRDLIRTLLVESTHGLAFHSEGGVTPLGERNNTPVGPIWLENGGRSLSVLTVTPDSLAGSLMYATSVDGEIRYVISGARSWKIPQIRYLAILGLPAPETWNTPERLPPLVRQPFQRHCIGYLVKVNEARPSVPADVPQETSPRKVDLSRCLTVLAQPETIDGITPPVPPAAIVADPMGSSDPANVLYRVVPLRGIQYLSCDDDGALRLRFKEEPESTRVILPEGSLEEGAGFRFLRSDLSASVSTPPLREIMGVIFSGYYRTPIRRHRHLIYLPFTPDELQPFLPAPQ